MTRSQGIQFEIILYWTNGIVTLQLGAMKIIYNICPIKPYRIVTDADYDHMYQTFIYFFVYIHLNILNKVINWIHIRSLM